ncbi:MAG TPA: ATP-binding protein [Casimicrobiaceae bacterium]|jgi:two-component system osmolarity sensor histidine kinase EnvZ
MTTIEGGINGIRSILGAISDLWNRLGAWVTARMPKRLYARSLLIIVLPMVILQSVVAFVFMERHYNLVTRRLSASVTSDVAALIDIYQQYPQDKDATLLRKIASEKLGLRLDLLPGEQLPPPAPKPFFSILDSVLSQEISKQIKRPFWIDTVGNSNLIEIRIQLDDNTMRVFAQRNQAYASNSHIFILWMVGTSLVLIGVAIIFLRNQIKPILKLAEVADAFGKGREVANFRPRGAIEVRQAAFAFLEMKRRIERQIDQRTTMLAGVSHDLRTILTRFKLELAILEDNPDTVALRRDVDEMQRMLEAYLAFARGDVGEQPSLVNIADMLGEFASNAERRDKRAIVAFSGPPIVQLRADSFKRCVGNLVANAVRYGSTVAITGTREPRWLSVTVDDDGPGIPADRREDVFRPFLRLDNARNQNEGGTGLGLSIARDIAGSHGGDITLAESPLGGLRATIRIPV